jgi:hypothetical protein
VSIRARREALTLRSPRAHPSSTLPHPAREVGVLKRHSLGEGESELGAFPPRKAEDIVMVCSFDQLEPLDFSLDDKMP